MIITILLLKSIHKSLKNFGDLVTIEQLNQFGWKNIDFDSIDELNRCLYTFNIVTPVQIRQFLTFCTFKSQYGQFLEEPYDELSRKNLELFQKKQLKPQFQGFILPTSKNYYRGSGYLGLSGINDYLTFSKFIGDPNIQKLGADYVIKNFKWTSAGFVWYNKRLNKVAKDDDSLKYVSIILGGPLKLNLNNAKSFIQKPNIQEIEFLQLYEKSKLIWK